MADIERRRSARIKAKQERLVVIEKTNQYFPILALTGDDTHNTKARVSLPFVAQIRQNSQVEDLRNADPSFNQLQSTTIERNGTHSTKPEIPHNLYDLECLSDLTELSSEESERNKESSSENEKSEEETPNKIMIPAKRRTKHSSQRKDSKLRGVTNTKPVQPPDVVVNTRVRPTQDAVEKFKPRLGSGLTGKERKAQRRQQFAAYKRKLKASPNTEVLQANRFDVQADPRHTTTQWSGVNAKKDFRAKIRRDIERGGTARLLSELTKVPYQASSLSPFMLTQLLPAINRAAQDFVVAVKHPFKEQDRLKNARGLHWFSIAGHDRNNKEIPSLSLWHKENAETIQAFFKPGSAFDTLTKFGCRILSDNFPAIARHYQASAIYMKETYNIEPMFGLFWNWCLNAPRKEVKRVFCLPHVDHKNIALGVCMVFVYGHFNHCEKCWLVIWEAGIVLELPPGVFLLYPSSLFIHFNIDLSELPIVVTANGERPTQENSQPLFCNCSTHEGDSKWQEAEGRGSIIWFNQATMFQTSELGVTTIAKARDMGMDSRCDTNHWLKKDPVFPVT